MRTIFIMAAVISLALSTGVQAGDPIVEDPAVIDPKFPPAISEVSIDSDGERMNGLVYLADGEGPHPTVVLLHGFPGNEKNLDLAQAIRRSGWNVLFFHYRGAWGSDGTFSMSNAIEDVASALSFLRDPKNKHLRIDPDKIALIGHSMGGFMALQGGANDAAVSCVAGIAAPNLGAISLIANASPELLEGFMQYADQLRMLKGVSGDSILTELKEAGDRFDVLLLAPQFAGKNIFLIGGERDKAVDITVYESLVAAYKEDDAINLRELRLDADHSFSWHRITLATELAGWLNESCR
ncbi:MAG: hypothetical protein DHS20C05_08790 [Hyphococcus sp.]|nr:MAG: hypothetical protein DHS20C05_08790 [Marinicaulis sp.]